MVTSVARREQVYRVIFYIGVIIIIFLIVSRFIVHDTVCGGADSSAGGRSDLVEQVGH